MNKTYRIEESVKRNRLSHLIPTIETLLDRKWNGTINDRSIWQSFFPKGSDARACLIECLHVWECSHCGNQELPDVSQGDDCDNWNAMECPSCGWQDTLKLLPVKKWRGHI
jgi:hypothetical protein